MNERARFADIEAYLARRMAPEQAKRFEAEIAADEDLATEVELQRLELDAMELMLEKDLRSKMGNWKLELPPPPQIGDVPPARGLPRAKGTENCSTPAQRTARRGAGAPK